MPDVRRLNLFGRTLIPDFDSDRIANAVLNATAAVASRRERAIEAFPPLLSLARREIHIPYPDVVSWHLTEITKRVSRLVSPRFNAAMPDADDLDYSNDHLRSRTSSDIAHDKILWGILLTLRHFDEDEIVRNAAQQLMELCNTGPPPDCPFQDDVSWH